MTLLKELEKDFTFPFVPHAFQINAAKKAVERDACLIKFKVGLGKTFTSLLAALRYSQVAGVEQILVLCPPILLDQWEEFIKQVGGIPEVILYRGTPAERKKMDIEDSPVVLMSYNIFRGKADYARVKKMGKSNKMCIIADELSLKNLRSQTYRKLKEVLYRKLRIKEGDRPHHKLIALNATPLSDLLQVYNWCSLFLPGRYGSKRLFEYAHVLSQDHWGNVLEWRNEDLLTKNMNELSIDTKKTVKLPPLVETITPYNLSKKHKALYEEVKEAELSALPEEKMELAINSLFSTLQRLVLLPEEFGLDESPPIKEFLDGYLDQTDPNAGILIYSRHVAVSRWLAANVPDSVAIYGEISKPKREEAFKALKAGTVRRLVGNLDSLGIGLNLQMLNHIVCVELPFRDDKLIQSIGRVHRQGQKDTCFANYPLAKGTIQFRIFERLIQNGEQLNKVVKTRDQARDFLS